MPAASAFISAQPCDNSPHHPLLTRLIVGGDDRRSGMERLSLSGTFDAR
jgi:hypothetical protein